MNQILEELRLAPVGTRAATGPRDEVPGSPTRAKFSRKRLRLLVQCVIAVTLLIYVASIAPLESLASAWNQASPQTLVFACGCFVVGVVISARRWQLLLHWQGIDEGLLRLIEVYFIGMFCSLFLPTAAGGDVFRVYDVSRRRGPTVRVMLATLQDRLVGLGATMLVGLVGTLWFRALLPGVFMWSVVATYVFGLLMVAITLSGIWLPIVSRIRHKEQSPWRTRISAFLGPLREVRPLTAAQTIRAAVLALATFAAAVIAHWMVCQALGAECAPFALCVVVSLVGIARMLPISPNGAGVGEGALVFLIGLFGVAESGAALVALVMLAIQVLVSLVGGLLLLRRALSKQGMLSCSAGEFSSGGSPSHAA